MDSLLEPMFQLDIYNYKVDHLLYHNYHCHYVLLLPNHYHNNMHHHLAWQNIHTHCDMLNNMFLQYNSNCCQGHIENFYLRILCMVQCEYNCPQNILMYLYQFKATTTKNGAHILSLHDAIYKMNKTQHKKVMRNLLGQQCEKR